VSLSEGALRPACITRGQINSAIMLLLRPFYCLFSPPETVPAHVCLCMGILWEGFLLNELYPHLQRPLLWDKTARYSESVCFWRGDNPQSLTSQGSFFLCMRISKELSQIIDKYTQAVLVNITFKT